MKLWSGRFDKNTDKLVDELNASITFDKRFFKEDIKYFFKIQSFGEKYA